MMDESMLAPGVNINLVSTEKLAALVGREKIQFILDEVRAGKILVLERGLDPREEANLIEETMRNIDADEFIGIEMQSYGAEPLKGLQRVLAKKKTGRPRMAVIGPADKLRTIHKDSQEIQTMILAPEGLVEAEA